MREKLQSFFEAIYIDQAIKIYIFVTLLTIGAVSLLEMLDMDLSSVFPGSEFWEWFLISLLAIVIFAPLALLVLCILSFLFKVTNKLRLTVFVLCLLYVCFWIYALYAVSQMNWNF